VKRYVLRLTFALATAASLALPMHAAAAPLDELDRFTGTWQSQGSFVTTPYSQAAESTATTICAWSQDRLFMLCQQSVTIDGKRSGNVAVYTYDGNANVYHLFNVGASRATTSDIIVNGDTIVYPFSFDDNGKTVMTRTLNVWKNPKLYLWRTEYSTDGGKNWTTMASGTSQRQ